MKNRLKIIRAERGLTQEKLAALSNLSRVTINQIENEIAIPDGETISKLVKATGVPANEIFFDLGVV